MNTQLKDRISKRISALGTNVSRVERACGFKHAYISDVMIGRKKTLKPDAVAKLAPVLKTTEAWLSQGFGPESLDERDVNLARIDPELAKSTAGTLLAALAQVASVTKAAHHSILIKSLDLQTGRAMFYADANQSIVDGYINDPELWMPGNPYTSSMNARRSLRVTAKGITNQAGEKLWVVIDHANIE